MRRPGCTIREFKNPPVPRIDAEGERRFTPGHGRDFLFCDMAKHDKLDQVAEQYKTKLLEEAKDSLNSLAEDWDYIAKKQKHVEKLANWGNAIIEQRRKLEKGVVTEKKNLARIQQTHIKIISSTLLSILEDGVEFNYKKFSEIERIFWNIEWLIHICSREKSEETYKRTSKSLLDLIEATNFRQKDKVENLTRQIHEFKVKFHQDPDPVREVLYKGSIRRYFKTRQGMIGKRAYTFGTALQDENKDNHYYPEKEFGIIYTGVVNHFKTWRSRNKDFVLEIEKGYTGVT